MNWPRIVLDGISMCLLFNAVVGMGFMLWPQAYSTMFPKLQRSFKPGDPKSRRAVCGQAGCEEDEATALSAVSAAVRLLGCQRPCSRNGRLWDNVLDGIYRDNHGKHQRLCDSRLLVAGEGEAHDQRCRALQGLGTLGVVENAGDSGVRAGLDDPGLPDRWSGGCGNRMPDTVTSTGGMK